MSYICKRVICRLQIFLCNSLVARIIDSYLRKIYKNIRETHQHERPELAGHWKHLVCIRASGAKSRVNEAMNRLMPVIQSKIRHNLFNVLKKKLIFPNMKGKSNQTSCQSFCNTIDTNVLYLHIFQFLGLVQTVQPSLRACLSYFLAAKLVFNTTKGNAKGRRKKSGTFGWWGVRGPTTTFGQKVPLIFASIRCRSLQNA